MNPNVLHTIAHHHQCTLNLLIEPTTNLMTLCAFAHGPHRQHLGGCRAQHYVNLQDAVTDACRLAQGMANKAHCHQLPLGGAKSIIIKPKHNLNWNNLLTAFAHFVHSMKGRYITAIDCGTTMQDMNIIKHTTPYVIAENPAYQEMDPSFYTAKGVCQAINAVCTFWLKKELRQTTCVLQGLGKTGSLVCAYLLQHGATVYACELEPQKITAFKDHPRFHSINPNHVLSQPCDLLIPCALGPIITQDNSTKLNTKAIVSCANNVLATADLAKILHQQNILYIPDFLANGGGLIFAYYHYINASNALITQKINAIAQTVHALIKAHAQYPCTLTWLKEHLQQATN
jgi:leucine dehydrogenase